MQKFFASGRKYAVLGASTSPMKFGNRILKWYINHGLDVTPINPRAEKVCDLPAFKTLNEFLGSFKQDGKGAISASVVTAPNVSYELFREVKEAQNEDKIAAVWFQPGSYDDRVVDYVRKEIGLGDGDAVISDGDCILVSGVRRMRAELAE